MADMAYTYKKLDSPDEELELQELPQASSKEEDTTREERPPYKSVLERNPRKTAIIAGVMFGLLLTLAVVGVVQAAILGKRETSTISSSTTDEPQYFQTTPELFAGIIAFLSSHQTQGLIK